MIIEVCRGDGDPTYLVRYGADVYEMSDNANMPNGVCMYAGEYSDFRVQMREYKDRVPIGIVRALVDIAVDQERWGK